MQLVLLPKYQNLNYTPEREDMMKTTVWTRLLFQNSFLASEWKQTANCSPNKQVMPANTDSMDSIVYVAVCAVCPLTKSRFVFDCFPLQTATIVYIYVCANRLWMRPTQIGTQHID